MQKHEVSMFSMAGVVGWPAVGGYLGYKLFKRIGAAPPDIGPFVVAGAVLGIVAAIFYAWFLREYCDDGFRGLKYRRWLRGVKMENWHALKSKVDTANHKHNRERKREGKEPLTPIMIGPVPMPLKLEDRHTIFCASTGAGKSTALETMIFSALKRRDKMVIVDPNGTFYSKFGLSGDIILNPFDTRSVGWSVYNEMCGDYDFDRIAKSLIPPQINPEDEQWCSYTRDVLADVMRKLAQVGNRNQRDLINMLVREDTKTLETFLQNSDSQGYFRDNAEKAIASVQFMINKYVRPLRLMDNVPEHDFSLHDWIHDPAPSNLYISWREDMRSAQRPLVAAWIDIICATVLSAEPIQGLNRFWLFVDELDSLGRLESFVPAATRGRKHGLRIVGSIQDWSQLDQNYGADGAKTLLACFRNYVIFAASNAYNADKASQILGKMEVEREQRTKGIGSKATSSMNTVRAEDAIVMDSQISTLEDLSGFVMFGEGEHFPVAKIHVPYIDRRERHAGIILR
jgi:type IV secretory pathway TraG/TraD family ATPase VirD4